MMSCPDFVESKAEITGYWDSLIQGRCKSSIERFSSEKRKRNDIGSMLSKIDNELLTRTGSGTHMGEMFRRYWIPAVLSEEIPVADCPPVQVRLLGEELV